MTINFEPTNVARDTVIPVSSALAGRALTQKTQNLLGKKLLEPFSNSYFYPKALEGEQSFATNPRLDSLKRSSIGLPNPHIDKDDLFVLVDRGRWLRPQYGRAIFSINPDEATSPNNIGGKLANALFPDGGEPNDLVRVLFGNDPTDTLFKLSSNNVSPKEWAQNVGKAFANGNKIYSVYIETSPTNPPMRWVNCYAPPVELPPSSLLSRLPMFLFRSPLFASGIIGGLTGALCGAGVAYFTQPQDVTLETNIGGLTGLIGALAFELIAVRKTKLIATAASAAITLSLDLSLRHFLR